MTLEQYRHIMDVIGTGVDGIGVLIVVGGVLAATARLAIHRAQNTGNYYSLYRQDVGRAILLGLEFLIAGDLSLRMSSTRIPVQNDSPTRRHRRR
jgi:uncharacterized membrane protein